MKLIDHQGYDLSRIPTRELRLLACVVSAASAGICEEKGFPGYMHGLMCRSKIIPAAKAGVSSRQGHWT